MLGKGAEFLGFPTGAHGEAHPPAPGCPVRAYLYLSDKVFPVHNTMLHTKQKS